MASLFNLPSRNFSLTSGPEEYREEEAIFRHSSHEYGQPSLYSLSSSFSSFSLETSSKSTSITSLDSSASKVISS